MKQKTLLILATVMIVTLSLVSSSSSLTARATSTVCLTAPHSTSPIQIHTTDLQTPPSGPSLNGQTINLMIPPNDPDRMYYVDVYTGQSILCYETPDIVEALNVCCQFVHPAQVVSFYSYKHKHEPYKIRNYVNFN